MSIEQENMKSYLNPNGLLETNNGVCKLDQSYWNKRWQKNEIGWDIKQPSPAIVEYMKQYPNKNAKILIPGCGNAHEAEFLITNGFNNITLIDIAPKAVERLKEKFADQPQVKVLCRDFFLHKGSYDIIIEQTFFCAIPPTRKKEYAEKMATLLDKCGKVIGVLFDKEFSQAFPPFGGHTPEYRQLFNSHFIIKKMDKCYNSIKQRANTEVFINLIKK